MSAPYRCGELVAVERTASRAVVERFARKLYDEQLALWERNAEQGRPNKPRPPTPAECLDKSRQIRVRRERDSTYFNDLVSTRPLH